MPKLTIITACSRPDNLETLAESILPGRDLFDITWRVVFDGMRALIGERRFQINAYNADGLLYQQLYAAFPRDFVFINRPLCYYNHLGRV